MTDDAHRLVAATVLYKPEAGLLRTLCDALDEGKTSLIAICNSVLEPELRAGLERRATVTPLGDGENIGLGAALNHAMEAAEAAGFTHVMLFDQDSTPEPDLPSALLQRALSVGGNLGAIGPRLVPPPGEGYKPIWYSFRGSGPSSARPVDFLPTSGSVVPVAAWRAVGPFRADFFIDGIDIEWSFRAWAAGYRMVLADDLTMRHCWGQPAEDARRAQIFRQGGLRNAYYLRNAVHQLRLDHVPRRWKLRSAARLAAQTLLLAARGQGGSALKAIRAGWRGELGPLN